jgi:hypothetical protein
MGVLGSGDPGGSASLQGLHEADADVIVQPWQEFTGKAAELVDDEPALKEAIGVSSDGCASSGPISEPSRP